MRKKWNALAFMLVMCLGGVIGFRASPNQSLQANEITKIRWVDVPKTDVSVPNLINIDLNKDKVSFSGNTDNTTVRIEKETIEVPKYIIKEKEVYVPVVDKSWSNKLLDRVAPLTPPKINVDRN